MAVQTAQVFEYLDSHPVSRYEGDFQSLLEMLHDIYSTCNPIDSKEIRARFQGIRNVAECLAFLDADTLFSEICLLCYEYEKLSFFHGMTVGMHLMTEINAIP